LCNNKNKDFYQLDLNSCVYINGMAFIEGQGFEIPIGLKKIVNEMWTFIVSYS